MGMDCARQSDSMVDNRGNKSNEVTIQSSTGTIIKKFKNENDLNFWLDMQKTGFIKIETSKKDQVEFNFNLNEYSSKVVPFRQIVSSLISENNFFYFPTAFEITLGILDFLEKLIEIKKKNKREFFNLINFEEFYLLKDESGIFSKLIYLDCRLNEEFSMLEIVLNDDECKSSFRVNGNEALGAKKIKNESTFSSNGTIDLNNYFYNKCNENYSLVHQGFTYQKMDNFYAKCVLNFVGKFLIKKTDVKIKKFDKIFRNIKNFANIGFNNKFLTENLPSKYLTLHNLKQILCNYYLNSIDIVNYKNICFKLISETMNAGDILVNEYNLKADASDKVLEYLSNFRNEKIALILGNCSDNKKEKVNHPILLEHRICFLSDLIDYKNSQVKKYCINCYYKLVNNRVKEGESNKILLKDVFLKLKDEGLELTIDKENLYHTTNALIYFDRYDENCLLNNDSEENVSLYKKDGIIYLNRKENKPGENYGKIFSLNLDVLAKLEAEKIIEH